MIGSLRGHSRTSRLSLSWRLVLACLGLGVGAAAATGHEDTIAVDHQVQILLKVLTYDRQLEQAPADTIYIGVLYAPDRSGSRLRQAAISERLAANAGKTINGKPYAAAPIPFLTAADLKRLVARQPFHVFYLTEGLAAHVKEIAEFSQEQSILTMSGIADYVPEGICVGLGVKDGRPEIIVNLAAARAAGRDFEARLLRLCRMIR